MRISFSFDDNEVRTLDVASIFKLYKFPATFFINIIPQQGHTGMSVSEIKSIYQKGFEIGAHTVSHMRLPELPPDLAEWEITQSKIMLESMLNCKISGFCYPKGQSNIDIQNLVQKTGFKYARSTGEGNVYTPRAFHIVPTVQIYNKPYHRFVRNQRQSINSAYSFTGDWRKTAVNFIKKYENDKDTTIRIFGHGWEIEQQNLWNSLSELLSFIEENNYEVTVESNNFL